MGLIFTHDFQLPDGTVWHAQSEGEGNPWICIPLKAIEGMTAEEIGQHVLNSRIQAEYCDAEMYASWVTPHNQEGLVTGVRRQIVERFEGWSDNIDLALQILRGQYVRPAPQKGGIVGRRKLRSGYVYLLKAGDYYKIGRAAQADQRLMQLEVQLPWPAVHIHTFASSDMYWAERALHVRFADKRLNGEWFNLDADDVRWICSLTQLEQEEEG